MTYPVDEIIRRARKGRHSVYPMKSDVKSFSLFGADLSTDNSRFPTLNDILIAPPQFTPERLEKCNDLIYREPIHLDVDTSIEIGGFKASSPIIQASMGSPEDWNRVASYVAEAAARNGIIIGIGENVASTWGYDKPIRKDQPTLMDRILAYLDNASDGIGGIVIQQNEEDAHEELWNKLYTDPRLTKYFATGMIGFEIKCGQGAKAGMGGEKLVDRQTALRLNSRYNIYPDPERVIRSIYERFSAPDIFTEDILLHRIKKLKNDYPRAKIWVKTGPYRDLSKVISVVKEAEADCLVIDGKEGGTGMSPSVAINQLGIPTLACLAKIRRARGEGITLPIVISGRLVTGADIVKSLALGASGVAMGRPFVIAAYAYPFAGNVFSRGIYRFKVIKKIGLKMYLRRIKSVHFVDNFIESLILELQLLTAAVGKYHISRIKPNDVIGLSAEISSLLSIQNIYGSNNAQSESIPPISREHTSHEFFEESVSA